MLGWLALVIGALGAVLSVIFIPKAPKTKGPTLEDFAVPTADDGRPIPVVFGTALITGSNNVWYGDFLRVTQTHDGIKTRKYYLGLHFAVCHGPVDSLNEIRVSDKVAWSGDQTDSGTILIDAGDLFGGKRYGGGVVGYLDVMMGEATQAANPYLSSVQDGPQPAYRGVFSVVANQMYVVANSTSIGPWAFSVQRIVNGWYQDTCWYPETAKIPIFGDSLGSTSAGVWTVEVGAAYYNNLTIYSTETTEYTGTAQEIGENAVAARNAATGSSYVCTGTLLGYADGRYAIVAWDASRGPYVGIAAADVVPTCSIGQTVEIIENAPDSNIGGVDNPSVLCHTAGVSYYGMNPAHIIYECLTNPLWGLGYPTSIIDDTSFAAAADIFFVEQFALSLIWNRQSDIDEFIQIIIDHVGAILYVDPATGTFNLLPIRGNYDAGSLPEYDESDIVKITDFQRSGYSEITNEVVVVYKDPATGKDASSAPVQNLAAIQAQGGVSSVTIQYPALASAALAARVAMRELRARSTPYATLSVEMNRQAWDVYPGMPLKISWAKFGLSSLICRVLEIDRGTITDGKMTLKLAEDVFGLPDSVYSSQQSSLWTESVIDDAVETTFDRTLEDETPRFTESGIQRITE